MTATGTSVLTDSQPVPQAGRVEIVLPDPRRKRKGLPVSIVIGLAIAVFGICFAAARLIPGLLPQ